MTHFKVAKEADGEGRVRADDGGHDRKAEDASRDPREQVGVLVDLDIDRSCQSHEACFQRAGLGARRRLEFGVATQLSATSPNFEKVR